MCNCTSQEDFSASNIHKNGCPLQIPGECTFYSGVAIPSLGINPGDTLNSVIRKLAIKLGAIVDDIEDNSEAIDLINSELGTPTTTSTTTTSTTLGTTTTSTSTTSTSTSSTTTSTTTPGISSLFYVGQNDTGTAPNSSQILAGLSSTQNETQDVTANWTSFNSAPHYLWFAVKQNGTGSLKNQWYESVINNGAIGTSDDLFGALTVVSVSGVNYYVGITNYVTQFTNATVLLKHV